MEIKINGKSRKIISDLDIGAHCPKHGAGANIVHALEYSDGDVDIFCHCGNYIAAVRAGYLNIRAETSIEAVV